VTTIRLVVSVFLLVTLAWGCGSGDLPLETVDPDAVPAEPTYDQVFSILESKCAPCHGSNSGDSSPRAADRSGVEAVSREDDLDYASCAGIVGNIDGLVETGIVKGNMPPGAWPRFTSEERLIVQRWIDNGACAPCAPCN